MKKNKKKFIIICLLSIILLTSCTNKPSVKEQVLEIYENNKDIIVDKINSSESNIELSDLDGILRIHKYDDGIIEFECVSFGLLTSSVISGFYYSPNDEPYIVEWYKGEELVSKGNGYFYTDGTDNEYYTERISENFYYFNTSN